MDDRRQGPEWPVFRRGLAASMMVCMADIDGVWARIRACAGQEFRTITGVSFAYEVPGNYLRVNGINRNLSRTNFTKAIEVMPAVGPGQLEGRQGASYTWAILMDPRIREDAW